MGERGSAIVEFAITLPLLVVFVVGIFDFSGAFNQKQKIAQAAQEGAILAGAQPMTDIRPGSVSIPYSPVSLQAVVAAILNSLAGSGVIANATCGANIVTQPTALSWKYEISGCSASSDNLIITINRGLVSASASPAVVGTVVTVTYPYHWRFNSVIQLLPGSSNLPTVITESATVHNQM